MRTRLAALGTGAASFCLFALAKVTRRRTLTCTLGLSAEKTSLEEASTLIGVALPAPTYLPSGYSVREVYIDHEFDHYAVISFISDSTIHRQRASHTDLDGTHQRYRFECAMQFAVYFYADEPPTPLDTSGERRSVRGRSAYLTRARDHQQLWWQSECGDGTEGTFRITLLASTAVPETELLKTAESVR